MLTLGSIIENLYAAKTFLDDIKKFPSKAHPMDAARTAVSIMGLEDKETKDNSPKANMRKVMRIFAKTPTALAAAQAAIDDWDERYYGPVGSGPSTRPGGGSRVQGDLYFDTTAKKMKVYNGSTSQWDDVAQSSSSHKHHWS